jgi:hypothetical protein
MLFNTSTESNFDSRSPRGLEGPRTPQTTQDGKPVASPLLRSVSASWKPAVVGAYIGALAASLGHKGKPAYGTVLLSGLLGATIGFTSKTTFGPRA